MHCKSSIATPTTYLRAAPTPFRVEEISAAAALEQVYRLRVVTWRERLVVPGDIGGWSDRHDAKARHWGVFNGGTLVAAARLTLHHALADLPDADVYAGILEPRPLPVAALSRCVVHPDQQGKGLATRLDQVRIEAARIVSTRLVAAVLECNTRRAAQLSALGFVPRGMGVNGETATFFCGQKSHVFEMTF